MTNIYAKDLFVQHGFTITDTGGGCRAWHKTVTGPRGTFHAFVTDDDGNLPDYDNIHAVICKDYGTGEVGDCEAIWADSSDFAADCLAELEPSLAYHAGIES